METAPADPGELPPDEETIQRWVLLAKTGDEDAFARLVEIFAQPLQALIYRMLLDWEETHDIAQETFIRAHRALSRYEPRARFQSWLFQIGVRQAYDALRRRKRRPDHSMNPAAAGVETLEKTGRADPAVERNEVREAIEQAVRELPAEQRTAFVLAEYEGCDHKAIGSVIGASAKSVEMHLYRARLTLRERLKMFL